MGDTHGFLKIKRRVSSYRPVCERVLDYQEVVRLRSEESSAEQGARCMDCGTPFCHWGCPTGNYIPEWNDLIFHGQWEKAIEMLSATNNLPEITGRICPAPCEYACVLGINDDPVTIRENELAVVLRFDKARTEPVEQPMPGRGSVLSAQLDLLAAPAPPAPPPPLWRQRFKHIQPV